VVDPESGIMNPRAVRSSMDYRFEAIEPFVRGRDVLDLGAGSGYWRDDWVHSRIRGVAKSALGVDHTNEYVEESVKRGADMVLGDVETLDLGEKFDVVVAGEIVEHLSNVGLFLETCQAHLRPSGRLLVTTPNTFSLSNLLRRGLLHQPPNPDHTSWFCERTLAQSVVRYGFEVEREVYLRHDTPGVVRRSALRPINMIAGERLAASTILLVAKNCVGTGVLSDD
jgi:2-polyprenyl-3-methyl-5-hydroxy-6-metoxy-1,4-benzoquinol methylase